MLNVIQAALWEVLSADGTPTTSWLAYESRTEERVIQRYVGALQYPELKLDQHRCVCKAQNSPCAVSRHPSSRTAGSARSNCTSQPCVWRCSVVGSSLCKCAFLSWGVRGTDCETGRFIRAR